LSIQGCDANPVSYVGTGFTVCQRAEMAPHDDSLTQLPEVIGVQYLSEFRLSHQDDLQKFMADGFKI